MSKTSKDILKSTGLIGGSKIVTIMVHILQTKWIAILLGPYGVGLVSLFTTALQLVGSITGLGLDFSAVRDVAEAYGSGDEARMAKTINTMRRWVWLTGILGILVMAIFCRQISEYSFGSDQHAAGLVYLSVILLLNAINGGQMAVVRGYRRIADLARANIYGAFLGLFICLPVYYRFGVDGIIPVLVITSAANLLLSWHFARKIKLVKIEQSLKESLKNGWGMVKLGIFSVVSGAVTTATLYYVQSLISERAGVESVGFYAAATALSSNYVGLVLNAMGTDYFPRLSSINKDNEAVNQLVNEQTQITLLLGVPLIVGMYAFSGQVISLLYTAKFIAAKSLLQWMLIGVYIRFIGFPIGYVFLAKAKGKIFIYTQSSWNLFFLAIILSGWDFLKLEIVGIAFSAAYFLNMFNNYFIIRKVTGFVYAKHLSGLIIQSSLLVISSFCADKWLGGWGRIVVLTLLLGSSCLYSYKKLDKIISLSAVINKIKKKLGRRS